VPEAVEVSEGDVRLRVDLRKGQKTGLFLDQRENHVAARQYARGRALDCFSYDGGFALQIARACDAVTAVDLSAESLERVGANAARSGLTNVTTRNANVFDLLRSLDDAGERFDTVILDPPAFAKSRDAVEKAVRGYKEINLRALKILRAGGCLVTCSCSYHVHEVDFEAILAAAAVDAGATVTVVEKRRQARDHPIVLGVPETYYLKCFVLHKLA
jgi:23S rRNA (cytosine1962-C5)-methyltransferase